jgi:hypothetical protein
MRIRKYKGESFRQIASSYINQDNNPEEKNRQPLFPK